MLRQPVTPAQAPPGRVFSIVNSVSTDSANPIEAKPAHQSLRMKIYHCVESYYPSIGGMQEVVRQISERLAKLGHEVTILTRFDPRRDFSQLNGVAIRTFNVSGNSVTAQTAPEREYINFLMGTNYDVVTFFAAQQWATNLALPILSQIRAKKVSVPTGYSGLYSPAFKTYFESMKSWIHGYDMNVYLGETYRDIQFARDNGVSKLCIIPNGAAADEFLPECTVDVRRELGIPEDDFLVLLVGSHTGLKGHPEAIELFLRSQIKKGTLLMIGNDYQAFRISPRRRPLLAARFLASRLWGGKRIIFNQFSRLFTVAAYKQADLFLFPSNVECSPIVLFECAASKLPFLATDVGNSKEITDWTRGGEILPTEKDAQGYSHAQIEGSVAMLNALYHDQARRERMGAHAHAVWRREYTWEVIAEKYERMYYNLTAREHARS